MRKLALRGLVASIALSALVGIYVLVFGSGGEVERKVLGTALTTSGLSILIMACGAGLERGKLFLVPHLGIVTSILGWALLQLILWELADGPRWAEETLGLITWGVAAALACLLALATLAPRFAWVRWLGYAADLAVAVMVSLIIWHVLADDSEAVGRTLGVLSILLAAATVAVPILHRMSQRDTPGEPGAIRHCVSCGGRVEGAAGEEIRCPECGARFQARLLVPQALEGREGDAG